MVCEYSSGGPDAVEARQPDIHQDEIGFQRVNGVNSLQSICSFSHNLPWRRTFEHGADVPAPPLMVFDDQDAITQRHTSSNGSRLQSETGSAVAGCGDGLGPRGGRGRRAKTRKL
jgi:hypothetical protein